MERETKRKRDIDPSYGCEMVMEAIRDTNGGKGWVPEFGEPTVVHSKATNVLEIERMVAIEMNPRYCGLLLPVLSLELPLPGEMTHAKRVRKVDGGRLVQVLIEPILEDDDSAELIVSKKALKVLLKVSESIENDWYSLRSVEVPRNGPTDGTVCAAWTRDYWPVSIRAPDKMGKKEGQEMDPDEIMVMKHHMRTVLKLSEASKNKGNCFNACIIVNPCTNTIVGSGVDTSRHHPLKHPIMNAVQEVAAWQVSTWYHDLMQDCQDGQLKSFLKSFTNIETALDSGDRAGHCDLPPYLCTGYDCYVLQEPCAMCAMALVHSRLRRIVFCDRDEERGMLGGSGVRLHSLKSLNHHFVVYHLPLTDRRDKVSTRHLIITMVDESPKFSFVRLEEFQSFTIVWMIRNPVNTMNAAMWDELNRALQYVEADPLKKGIAFMSGVSKDVFTAGNDIMELYAPKTSKRRYRSFWLLSNTFLGNLYISRLVTVAGIRGACPAGGCCLSLCCDYRIMTEHGYIGLNEVALGISVPKFWGRLMEKTIGCGKAQKILQFATLLKSKEAYDLGLVDFLCSKSDLKQKVVEKLEQLVILPEKGRSETKVLLRKEFVDEWMRYLELEADTAWNLLTAPETVKTLGQVLEKLTGKPTQTAKL